MPPSLSGPSQSLRGQNGNSNPGFGATPGVQNSIGISQGAASPVALVAAPAPKVRRPGSAQLDISLNTNALGDGLLPPNSPLWKGSEESRRGSFSTSLDISMVEETASVGRKSANAQLAESLQEASVSRTGNRPRSHSISSNISMDQERGSVGRESVDSQLAASLQEAPAPRTGNRPRSHSSSSDISIVQETASVDERRPSDASLKESPQKAAEQEQEEKADKDSTSKESSSHPYLDRMKKNLKDGVERVLTVFDKRLVKPFNDTFDKHVKEPILKPLAKVLTPVAKLIKTILKALAVAMVYAAKLLNKIRKIAYDFGANGLSLMMPNLVPGYKLHDTYGVLSKLFKKKQKEPDDSSGDGEQANNDKSKKENETQENQLTGRNETAENYLLAQQAAQQGQQHS